MIFPRAKILLVDDDIADLSAFQRLLTREGRLLIETAASAEDGLRLARLHRPDLIISDYSMPGMDGFEFCRAIRADQSIASAMFVLITGFDDTELKVQGLNLGVDDYLTKPVEAAELIAKVRSMLRIKSLHDELRQDKEELERIHSKLGLSFDQLLRMLSRLLDLSIPGSSARGERLAEAAVKVADIMDVPSRFHQDLEVAALLHEIGKVVGQPDVSSSEHLDEPMAEWHFITISKAILGQVERLVGPAELVGHMFENWDGSGMPEHRRQGQIPLRSRILRVLHDFFAEMRKQRARGLSPEPLEIIDLLDRRSGTHYDPVVVSKVRAMIRDSNSTNWIESDYRVPVTKLSDGMKLAEDLTTSSGVKLLSAGAVLTNQNIGIITKRHATDPIIAGVLVSH